MSSNSSRAVTFTLFKPLARLFVFHSSKILVKGMNQTIFIPVTGKIVGQTWLFNRSRRKKTEFKHHSKTDLVATCSPFERVVYVWQFGLMTYQPLWLFKAKFYLYMFYIYNIWFLSK